MKQDNQLFRELLSLPPVSVSNSTSVAVVEAPAPEAVTGDNEIDAVLWLHKVIETGEPTLIDKAMEAAKLIKTPLKDIGMRYSLKVSATHGAFLGAMAGFGFEDLERKAKRAIEQRAKRHEVASRFGSEKAIFDFIPSEKACKKALRGVKAKRREHGFTRYDEAVAVECFDRRPELQPATPDDCLYGLRFWDRLYSLRYAVDRDGPADFIPPVDAHRDYLFSRLAVLAPRSADEALSVFRYLIESESMDREESNQIIENLISSGYDGSLTH